jgi:benzoylsuccinyl-CoA thiolase BbsB subunit
MSENVYVTGASMIPMGKYPDASYAGLAVPPLIEALRHAGIPKEDVGAVFCGTSFGGMMTAQRITKAVGIGHVPTVNVDNACSGGATAVHLGWQAIREGRTDVAIAIGVDKLTQFGGGTLPLVLEDREVHQGVAMPAVYAMRAQRYLHETDATVEDFAQVSVKSRAHGFLNPLAQMRKPTSVEEVLASRKIADPFTLLMCCPTGDGAAVVVLVSEEYYRKNGGPAIKVKASVLHSGMVDEGTSRSMIRPTISELSANDAYKMAGIGPDDVDTIELHDAFAAAEIIYYETFGLAPWGEGFKLMRDGATTFGGKVVVNPSGGLLSKGHPVGASGVAQVAEMFWQLTGTAGARQVDNARIGMTHVTGGGLSGLDHGACTMHIFEGV